MSRAGAHARASSVPDELCIPRLLEVWANTIPDAVAIAAPGRTALTYGRLWKHVKSIVHTLRAMGVGRRDRIAMILPQGPEMATAFLAVATGASSAPLNPAYRTHEFDFYLADLNAKALLIQSQMDSPARAIAQARSIPIIELVPVSDAEAGIFTLAGALAVADPLCDGFAEAADLALLLHTSGTTSRPKSVPLTQMNICSSARNIAASLALVGSDRCLNIMPLFHIHGLIAGTLASISSGASVVCPQGFYAPQFLTWLDEFRPTWYTAVPSMHQSILARTTKNHAIVARSTLRFIRSSSAPLPAPTMAELEQTFHVPVIEAYGMTEAAHQIASNPLPPRQRKVKSVGIATGDEVAILDSAGNVLPAGTRGEIAIRGANVISAYDNNSEANARAFINGWLRTGDTGFLDAEGYLFITGRLKDIINRGGEKIAPQEVEEVLLEHRAVAQAVVFAVPDVRLGEKVAAAVVLRAHAEVTEKELRQFAAVRLTEFKVPDRLLIVDDIPKGPTGKLQRMGLAEKLGLAGLPPEVSGAEQPFIAPRLPLEQMLAEIWSEILRVPQVGVHDNFFTLGGDSILAARIISRMRETMHVQMSFLAFLEAPTVAEMVKSLEAIDREVSVLLLSGKPSLSKNTTLPVSYAQESFLKKTNPGDPGFNRPAFFRLTGDLDVASLKKSLNEVFRRHKILRTTFSSIHGEWVQRVSPYRSLDLPVVDLRGLFEPTRSTEARRLSTEEAERPFNLARDPSLRAVLLQLDDAEYMLLLTIHHIAFDGWSQGVLLEELALLYEAFSSGKPSPLPDLRIQYADFAVAQRLWLRGEVLEERLAYWKKQLDGAPAMLSLPTDRPRPPVQTLRGARESVALSPALTKALKTLSQRSDASLFMTLLAAFQTLLHRITGQTDISVGTVIANRISAPIESLIGCFVNNVVLRTDLSGNPTFREFLNRVRKVCSGAYAHQDLPFNLLVERLQPTGSINHSPLFQVALVLQNTPQPSRELPRLTLERYPAMDANRSNFDLTLELSEDAGTLTGFLEYNVDLFDAATMRRMLEQFRSLLEAIVANPEERLSMLALGLGTVRNSSGRRENLAQRQSKLSAAQQSKLAQRLGGKFHSAPDNSEIPKYPGLDAAGLSPKLTARGTSRASAPLSFAQQRLWFMNQLEPDSPLYNITIARRVHGRLDLRALQQALDEIVVRHESLRTTFVSCDGDPVQRIDKPRPVTTVVVDLTSCPHAEKEREAQQRLHEETHRPFGLSTDLMLRARLLRLDEDEHFLIVAMPHIISDRWSMNILFQETATLYEAFSNGRPSPLAKLPMQYADFAVWQRQWLEGEPLEKQLGYWKEKLARLAVVELPTDYPHPALSREGARESAVLSKSLSEALKRLSRAEGVTLFMTLLAAFKILLQRHSGQDDIAVGSPIANRNRAELEPLIGLFLNTLVLRTDLSNNPSFRELLARVREVCLEAYTHQDLPFEKLVEELHPQRDLNRHPLFDILFNFDDSVSPSVDLAGLTLGPPELTEPLARFAITLYAGEQQGQLHLRLVYQKALFSAEMMRCFLEQFEYLLEQIVAHPEKPIRDYSLVTQQSRFVLPDPSHVLAQPEQELVSSLFASWAEASPQKPAVSQGENTWSYGELQHRAESLAHRLRVRGLKKGEVVGVYGSRSFGLIGSVLGVLLSGGVLLLIDPDLPDRRKQLMLRQAGSKRLLKIGGAEAQESWLKEESDLNILDVGAADGRFIDEDHLEPETVSLPELSPNDPAYIFFTSGTSGMPKGILGCHKGLSHFIRWQRETFDIGPEDHVAQLTNLSFDPVLRDIFLPLSSGATLCLPQETGNFGGDDVIGWLERERISVLHTVPSLVQSWLADVGTANSLKSLRWVFLAGEPLMEHLVRRWRTTFPQSGVEIVNLYGPTETTLAKFFYRVPAHVSPGVQPVGRPLPQTQALVLRENGRLCGIGEAGEIVLRTPFRTLGYINAAQENQRRFVKNPFGDDERDLLYYTGDRGRYRPDGVLEILGRSDDQVKIRGVRVEPDEVTAILSQHPALKECVVVASKDEQDQAYLAAYVVTSAGKNVTSSELRAFLSERLSAAMVPTAFVFLKQLPVTANGKLDRRALPVPERRSAETEKTFVAPRTPVEQTLAQIWSEILHVDRVGIDDNFFDLGGHSLLATQVMSRVRPFFGIEIPLRSLFESPTVAGLAERIETLLWAAKQFQAPASISMLEDHVEVEL